jgi:hypothetical protein
MSSATSSGASGRTVRLRDGRLLGCAEHGDPAGKGEGLTLQLRPFRFAAQHFPGILHLFRRQGYSTVNDGFDADSLLADLPAAERQQLQSPPNLEMLLVSIREGYRQGWQGVAQDDVVIRRP